MKYDFLLFGALGLQGRIVTRYLLEKGYKVLLSDIMPKERAERTLREWRGQVGFAKADLRDQSRTLDVMKASKAAVVVNCAEGDFNLKVQRLCLRTEQHYIDLGSDAWMTRYQFELDDEFRKKNLCAITGAGSVPGVGNVMLRHATEKLDRVTSVDVGFAWTANIPVFVVPFSIMTIMEEFTDRPAVVRTGKLVRTSPRADMHVRNFRDIGKQRIFLARHAEPYTFMRFLKRKGIKTVRFYAGFPEFSYNTIMTFIKLGLNSKEPLPSGAVPREVLTETLRRLPYPKRYREWENLWVDVVGTKNGRKRVIKMNCIAPTLPDWEEHGCNIDTGIPAGIMARMIFDGTITARGARSPEFFVPEKPFFRSLARWQMPVYENGDRIN